MRLPPLCQPKVSLQWGKGWQLSGMLTQRDTFFPHAQVLWHSGICLRLTLLCLTKHFPFVNENNDYQMNDS